jgi:hypothetical protein
MDVDPKFGLRPHAVAMPLARKLLADKSRSEVYEEIGLGNLDAVKDGAKTLITLESIERYMSKLPPAKIKPIKPRTTHRRTAERATP